MSNESGARTSLILARIAEEQEWAYNLRIRDGLHWHAIRALALRPREAGGIDRSVGVDTLKNLVADYRAAQGVIVGTRDERIERRQLEIDEIALLARAEIARAADASDPERHPRLDTNAAKLLLDVRAAEAKMHGDDAAQRVDIEVTTRTQLDAEIDELLVRIDAEPLERKDAS